MELIKSPVAGKKWRAVFADGTHTDFGASGYMDYTQHHDKLRRANYLSRHRTNEDWNDYKSAGALSRWLLWGESTDLQTNLRAFRRRFSLS
jgi:hypothetical protein